MRRRAFIIASLAGTYDADGPTSADTKPTRLGTFSVNGQEGMDAAKAAMSKCPASYAVRGGPAPILGTYSVSMRPLEVEGWSGVTQPIAHTYPTAVDNVYYEDATHVLVRRANVILYVDVTHRKIIGAATAQRVLKTVLKRLG